MFLFSSTVHGLRSAFRGLGKTVQAHRQGDAEMEPVEHVESQSLLGVCSAPIASPGVKMQMREASQVTMKGSKLPLSLFVYDVVPSLGCSQSLSECLSSPVDGESLSCKSCVKTECGRRFLQYTL